MQTVHMTERLEATLDTQMKSHLGTAERLWADHGYKATGGRKIWSELSDGAQSLLVQNVSIAAALADTRRGNTPVHEAATKLIHSRDGAAWFDSVAKVTLEMATERAKAVKRGDSFDLTTALQSRTDAFSPQTGGIPAFLGVQHIAENLMVPRAPVERMLIGVRPVDPGARETTQIMLERVGRAEKMDPLRARGGNITRRPDYIQTRLQWYAAEAPSTQFLELESSFAGLDHDPLSDVNEGLDLTLDEVFYLGEPNGQTPYGVDTHPSMRRHAGDTISAGSSVTATVNVVINAVRRLRSGSNLAAQTTLCQIGSNIWNRLARVTTEVNRSGLTVLMETFPQVTFVESARLTSISSGVDGILCVDQRAGLQGLRSMESARILVTYPDGPQTIVMGAQKSGGAYPALGIYSQLNYVTVTD